MQNFTLLCTVYTFSILEGFALFSVHVIYKEQWKTPHGAH